MAIWSDLKLLFVNLEFWILKRLSIVCEGGEIGVDEDDDDEIVFDEDDDDDDEIVFDDDDEIVFDDEDVADFFLNVYGFLASPFFFNLIALRITYAIFI